MNKYAARGLVEEALLSGKRVLVITMDPTSAVLDEIARAAPEGAIVKTTRATGAERIDFDPCFRAGWIRVVRFVGRMTAPRGLSLDVVFVDSGVDERIADPLTFYRDLHPTLATRSDWQIVRA